MSTQAPRRPTPARRPASPRPSRRRRIALIALGVLVGLFLLGLTAFGVAYARTDIPDPKDVVTAQTTVITWRDGREIGRVGEQNRIAVPLDRVPEHVRRAVLAAEDRGFYEQGGVSIPSITRAFWNNLRGGPTQGGSTITQQYAKNAFLTQERTWTRKIQEAFIAVKLDNQVSKDQILEDYLNSIYFGRGAYGVQTAAQAYFGKDVGALTVSEGAVLAAIIRSPGAYAPEDGLDRLRDRYAYVIDGMRTEGWLSSAQASGARFPQVRPKTTVNRRGGTNGYLIRMVEQELARRGFSEDEINRGGLNVTTTFDRRMQRAAVEAVREGLPEELPAGVRAGLAAVQPRTGAVMALYGGEDYLQQQFNNATQGTVQAGSTFKPFALVAALEEGIGLRSRYNGANRRTFEEYGDKPVRNFGDASYGFIDLLRATANSVNTVYVDLGIDVGAKRVVDVARRAGLPADVTIDPTPSVVLGPAAPRVIDMASAYATFAAQGVRAEPTVLLQVKGANGAVRYRAKPAAKRVFDKDVMADLTYALQGVVRNGSGREARRLGRPSAGKTGTAQENTSAWYVGFTPQLATAVAIYGTDKDGNPKSLKGVGGRSTVTGGSFPAQIWTDFMREAMKGMEEEEFPEPEFVGRTKNPLPRVTAPPRTVSPGPRTTAPRATRTATPRPTDPAETPPPTRRPGPPGTAPPPQGDGGGGGQDGGPGRGPGGGPGGGPGSGGGPGGDAGTGAGPGTGTGDGSSDGAGDPLADPAAELPAG